MDLTALRAPSGPVALDAIDPAATPGFAGGKSEGRDLTAAITDRMRLAQERLFACSRVGDDAPSVLLVLQGMDTSGKGGTVRKVIGGLDPQGVRIASFGAPTPEELRHDFLWRIRTALPPAGRVGVFDRSHYEDVLIGRVRRLASDAEIERRYEAIAEFEAGLAESGTRVVKVFLHISPDEQRERLLARLDDPRKHWKFSPADIDDRGLWRDYQQAYEVAIERTDAEHAPWHIVPAERKWYRDLAVAALLERTLSDLDLDWPLASFDVDEQRRRLLEEDPLR